MQVYQVLCPVEHGVDVSLAQNGLTCGGPCKQRLPVELWENGGRSEGDKWREGEEQGRGDRREGRERRTLSLGQEYRVFG